MLGQSTKTVKRKPEWLRVKIPGGDTHHRIKKNMRNNSLHTVCEEARCPNVGECWRNGTATLMILGDTCTRGCRFCSVKSGHPGGIVDPGEPARCAETVVSMNLNYVVLTCVDRDDLPDGGSGQFALVIRAIKKARPDCLIEVLVSDYQGRKRDIVTILDENPHVFAHNIETVERLTPTVRDKRASFLQSLSVLKTAKQARPDILTKSSIMLGLGESREEVLDAMRNLKENKVDIITFGQYLRPGIRQLEVVEYIHPDMFDFYAEQAKAMGFLYVASGPLVRSSYRAGELFVEKELKKRAFSV
ncbi:MAG: lipoyl synthase [Acidobacteria bacterium]|nr:MAG: lipoyl synthase [Acidobacteriota bacterium]